MSTIPTTQQKPPAPRKRLMRLGFIGTTKGLNKAQKATLAKLLSKLGPEEIHLGDHSGDDAEFEPIARIFPSRLIFHPHRVDKDHPYQSRAMLAKGSEESVAVVGRLEALRDIVDVAETMIFTPTEREPKSHDECWAAIYYARRRRKQIWYVFPDGQAKLHK
jgi:hypothetical protein